MATQYNVSEEALWTLISRIRPANEAARERAQKQWDSIAKPLGGLGLLEELVCRIAAVTGDEYYTLEKRAIVVMCADNGVVAEGVTQTDSAVTGVVAKNIAEGRASIAIMGRLAKADVFPIDIGMNTHVNAPGLRQCAVRRGTGNIAEGPAMTREETLRAIYTGIRIARELYERGYKLLATGEMGIGNTTTSSAVAAVLLGREPHEVTGRGAGLSDEGLSRKCAAIERATAVNHPDASDPIDVLQKVGGLDLAGLVGLILGGARCRIPVLLDGLIASVAALLAVRLCPAAADALLASHVSGERAAKMLLQALGLRAPLDAQLHLGEGTGAAALLPLLDMAYAVYTQMPTFADISLANYQKF